VSVGWYKNVGMAQEQEQCVLTAISSPPDRRPTHSRSRNIAANCAYVQTLLLVFLWRQDVTCKAQDTSLQASPSLIRTYLHGPFNKGRRIVGFEVLTAVSSKMAVYCVVAPCSLVEIYQRFGGPYCLHHQDDEGSIISHCYVTSFRN
jgi:hypothetical protein